MCEDNIAKDESLFCHTDSNGSIWLIRLINTNTKYFRIEAVKEWNSEILEKIIRHHNGRGNTIITDGWPSYSWLNQNKSGYHHIVHILGRHDFGFGEQSTSHVESIWSDIKRLISKYYVTVKPTNFIYYAKEIEWRKKVSKLYNSAKLANLKEILNHISITVEYELLEKSQIDDFDKEDYDIDLESNESENDENSDEQDSEYMDVQL